MDEIFNGWLTSESTMLEGGQGDTVVLTWTPIISRWTGLLIFLLGARAAKLNIATIKVAETTLTSAKLLIKQQKEEETTEKQFGDALARGRTVSLTPHIGSLENARQIAKDLQRLAARQSGVDPRCVP